MRYIIRRIGARFSGRWVVLAVLFLAGAVVAVLVVPAVRRGEPYVELVALGPDGTFRDTVHLPAAWTDTAASEWGPVTRFPLLLAIRNAGTRVAVPGRIEMSVPARYRLTGSGGVPIESEFSAGSPLVRYTVARHVAPVLPGQVPTFVAGPDTVWLEPLLPTVYCVAASDSVPEFVAAPRPDLARIGEILIFYSVGGGDMEQRQTGLMQVRLDTAALRFETVAPIRVSPATVRAPEIPGPELAGLRYAGHRRAYCGEPEDPVELFTTTWETFGGGRLLVLALGGQARKYLYDLTGDGVIDLERWDGDGDGRFEAMRPARFAIPPFLLPIERDASFDMSVFAQLAPDSLARLDPFRAAGTYYPRTSPRDTMPLAERFGRERMRPPDEAPQPRPQPRGPRVLGVPVD
jgi:hypothetical protein